MLKVNENFRRMAEDFNAQRQVINSLGESMGDWRREQQEHWMRLALSFNDLRRMNNKLSSRLGEEIAHGDHVRTRSDTTPVNSDQLLTRYVSPSFSFTLIFVPHFVCAPVVPPSDLILLILAHSTPVPP